ncbi:ras-related protein RABA1f-like [Senna tora]|uniref:Ras-related protein RABA1f-like n=1 Tax=Senna tora TaxID=362788 RepID=A0A834WGX5_9FABA|nr:ras-related protein RABA1f-like [Senna tora]
MMSQEFDTFENVQRLLKELRDYTDIDIVVMLVGNKADLCHQRTVFTEDAKSFAEKENIFFVEAFAKNFRAGEAFTAVVVQIYHVISQKALKDKINPPILLKGRTLSVGTEDGVFAIICIGIVMLLLNFGIGKLVCGVEEAHQAVLWYVFSFFKAEYLPFVKEHVVRQDA